MHPVFPSQSVSLKSLRPQSQRNDIPIHHRVELGDYPGFNSCDQAMPSTTFQDRMDTFHGRYHAEYFILYHLCGFNSAVLGQQSSIGAVGPSPAKRWTYNPSNGRSHSSITL